jgi:hypothetical protein
VSLQAPINGDIYPLRPWSAQVKNGFDDSTMTETSNLGTASRLIDVSGLNGIGGMEFDSIPTDLSDGESAPAELTGPGWQADPRAEC